MMKGNPVLTNYPHDRLSRLADEISEYMNDIPGIEDVRAIILLSDSENGCVHPWNYPDTVTIHNNGRILVDVAEHLHQLGEALGIEVGLTIDGKVVPFGK